MSRKKEKDLQICPKCNMRSLRIRRYCDGGKKHECLNECCYLMIWRAISKTYY